MRKVTEVTINDRGTDKAFRITEMAATKLEKWIAKAALIILGKTNFTEVEAASAIAEAAGKGFESFREIPFEQIEPLYDALLDCVEFKAAGIYIKVDPATIDGQIEDVQTLFKLRMEVLKLNLGFFAAAFPSITQTLAGLVGAGTQNTQTSAR
jgi:hypothetical protein